MQPDGAFGPILRQHHSPRPRLGRWRKRGQHRQALGRSRGGFPTKIHLKTDPGPDIRPRIGITDKGYDSVAIRAAKTPSKDGVFSQSACKIPTGDEVDRSAARKDFFSEEKKQKTFTHWYARYGNANLLQSKVFWFFFSKKNCFLPGASRTASPKQEESSFTRVGIAIKSFLVLFFKKELLSFFCPGTQPRS